MKSLEEVIKYKLNFLTKEIEPFYAIQTYTGERSSYAPPSTYEIYKTKNTVFSDNMFYFMEDILPLFIYISSCEKYYRENDHGTIYHISIHLFMVGYYEGLNFGFSTLGDSGPWIDFESHRIVRFKTSQIVFPSRPFTISFTGNFTPILTEEEIRAEEEEELQAEDAYYDEEDDDEELSINDFRVFKSEQCVICLEEKPKVLFCNCGHLCICGKCFVRKFDNCPICKKETTILRIIE